MPQTLTDRFWSKVQKTDGCWWWRAATTASKSFSFTIRRGKSVRPSRFAFELVKGPIPPGFLVCHTCDHSFCVNPSHLFIGTQQDNMRDMARKGRQGFQVGSSRAVSRRGSSNGTSKLEATQVLAIRASYATGTVSQRQLATTYGICQTMVRSILNRKTWGWLDTLADVGEVQTIENRFWSKVLKKEGCWEWQAALDPSGRGQFSLKRGKMVRAHRLAYMLIYGTIPPGFVVMHKCDNILCCRPDHLILGTHRANMLDMGQKKRQAFQANPNIVPRGERHGMSKLTEDSVRAIRVRHGAGIATSVLAAEYGVTMACIYAVTKRKTWKQVDVA